MTRRTLKICQMSDAHLGYKQYSSNKRYYDFFKAFEVALDEILKRKPDVVLCTGDLFNSPKPSADSLKRFFSLMYHYFQAGGAPFISIAGNHDYSPTIEKEEMTQVLNLFDDVMYVVFEGKFFTFAEDSPLLYGYFDTNDEFKIRRIKSPDDLVYDESTHDTSAEILFIGLNRNQNLLQRLIGMKDQFKHLFSLPIPRVLLIHSVTVEIEQDLKAQHETSLKMQDLHNIGFQYIGLGHQHRHKHYDKDHAYLPGSLEDYSDVEWTWEKGFYIVEAAWEERDPKSMETRGKFYAITRTRPREKVSWDIGRVTTEDAVTAIKTRLTDYVTREGEINPEKMYHVEVKGVLTDGRPGELDLGSLWTPFSQNEKDGFFQFTNKLVTVEEEAIAEVEDDDQLLEEIFAGDKYQDYIGETSEEKALFFKEVRDGVLRAATSTKISEKNAQAHSSFVVTVSPRLPEPALTFEDLVVKRHMGGGKE